MSDRARPHVANGAQDTFELPADERPVHDRRAPRLARVGNYWPTGATLYVTIEPCQMCVGAMVKPASRVSCMHWVH